MIRCLIVDDEPLAREVLESYIDEMANIELVSSCKDAMDAMELLKVGEIDLLLLDINMPQLSGISFYKTLVHKPQVIFTTAYADHAVEGFELEAVDYLLKPFSFERFQKAVSKVKLRNHMELDQDFIMLKSDKRTHKINYDQISHVESIGDYVKVFLNDGKALIVSETLKKLAADLPASQFLRVHKSYIISISQLEFIEGNQIKIPLAKIPVGQSYRDKVNAIFKK